MRSTSPEAPEGTNMKNKLAGFALAVGLLGGAGAGVILGVTQLSNAQTTTTPAAPATPADPGAAKSATGSNEDPAHEAGESAEREAAEDAGKAGFGRGHHRGGGSNEDPAHEAGESAAREAEGAAKFQLESDDVRIKGGFSFGAKGSAMLPFVNPVSTAFCVQALTLWSDRQRGALQVRREALI